MKYIEIRQFGAADTLELFEGECLSPGAGQIVIDVKASGVNFADVIARQGNYPSFPSAPFRPGLEVAGTVRAIGSGVSGFSVGDPVVALTTGGGGYASEAIALAGQVFALPDGFDFGVAAALLIQGMTAFFMLKAGRLKKGETVLVSSAAGGLGSLAVQMASLLGAKVIGLASEGKHQKVKDGGAAVVIDYRKSGWERELLQATQGRGIDIYLDASARLDTDVFDAFGIGGRWIIYGLQDERGGAFASDRRFALLLKNLTLHGYLIQTDFDKIGAALPDVIGWVQSGKLKVEVTRFPLKDARAAHEAIEARGTTGKVVLES